MKQYLTNILISTNQLVTTVLGGYPDETVSSYIFRLDNRNRLAGRIVRPVIDFLFCWQRFPGGHCYLAYLNVTNRYKKAPEYRHK
jgi:hypothetical protein